MSTRFVVVCPKDRSARLERELLALCDEMGVRLVVREEEDDDDGETLGSEDTEDEDDDDDDDSDDQKKPVRAEKRARRQARSESEPEA